MDRIHHPSAVASPPAVDAYGTPGYPTEGDPLGGIEATIFTAWMGHSLIEEMRNFIAGSGITPDKADLGQMLAAARAMFSGGYAVYGAAGTFIVPAGITRIKVRAWGAGGGGGGAGGSASAGTAGVSGAYGEGYFDVTPGASFPVTIGTGGVSGYGSGTNGGNGGTTSFGALMTVGGGTGGRGSVSGAASWGAVTPPSSVGGGIAFDGLVPANAYQIGSVYLGSAGPGAPGGGAAGYISKGLGANGSFPGGGGGGAGCNAAPSNGGTGAGGFLIVEW